jgi:hypothetical protein
MEAKMLKRKIVFVVVLLAALAGITAGRYYSSAVIGVAQAEAPQRIPPAWKDLQVLYLGPTGTAVSYPEFDPAAFTTEINAQLITKASDAAKHSQTRGLDVVIIDKSMLTSLDPAWAAMQYKRGTAFVGLNITPQELGALISDSDFANHFGTTLRVEPFLSYSMVRIYGNSEHIKLLEQENALYPPDIETRAKLGINDVFVSYGRGYFSLPKEGLAYALEDIRLNLDSQNLVRP